MLLAVRVCEFAIRSGQFPCVRGQQPSGVLRGWPEVCSWVLSQSSASYFSIIVGPPKAPPSHSTEHKLSQDISVSSCPFTCMGHYSLALEIELLCNTIFFPVSKQLLYCTQRQCSPCCQDSLEEEFVISTNSPSNHCSAHSNKSNWHNAYSLPFVNNLTTTKLSDFICEWA